jgi:hypothetical protein
MIDYAPPITWLRKSIETHILDLYEADGVTLRPWQSWPGFYTLPNKTRIPAVYVVGEQIVPRDWEITGIECTINDVPEDIEAIAIINGVVSNESWLVRFTQYGSKQGTEPPLRLLDVRRRLTRAFPRDRVEYQPRTPVSFESCTAHVRGAYLNPPIP